MKQPITLTAVLIYEITKSYHEILTKHFYINTLHMVCVLILFIVQRPMLSTLFREIWVMNCMYTLRMRMRMLWECCLDSSDRPIPHNIFYTLVWKYHFKNLPCKALYKQTMQEISPYLTSLHKSIKHITLPPLIWTFSETFVWLGVFHSFY